VLSVSIAILFAWLFIPFIVIVVIHGAISESRVSTATLQQWAREENLRFLRCRRAWFWYGPFFLTNTDGTIFRVTVEFQDGRTRRAWVCCLESGSTDVRWEKANTPGNGFPVIRPAPKKDRDGNR